MSPPRIMCRDCHCYKWGRGTVSPAILMDEVVHLVGWGWLSHPPGTPWVLTGAPLVPDSVDSSVQIKNYSLGLASSYTGPANRRCLFVTLFPVRSRKNGGGRRAGIDGPFGNAGLPFSLLGQEPSLPWRSPGCGCCFSLPGLMCKELPQINKNTGDRRGQVFLAGGGPVASSNAERPRWLGEAVTVSSSPTQTRVLRACVCSPGGTALSRETPAVFTPGRPQQVLTHELCGRDPSGPGIL